MVPRKPAGREDGRPEDAPGGAPEPRAAALADLRAALAAGWADFRRAPGFGLFFAAVFVAGGWGILWALTAEGTTGGAIWGTLVAVLGFPLLGPFAACGLYEVSRRLEAGERLDWPGVLGVVIRQKDRQIPAMAAVVVVFFLFWNFLAHMIFALFLGRMVMVNVSTSLAVFASPEGLAMLAFGTAVGAAFAGVLFALTVTGLPMLLDREIDFISAMIASWKSVAASPAVMLGWGAFVAVLLFAAMLPGFLGLFLALPVLGHATWHLYRSLFP